VVRNVGDVGNIENFEKSLRVLCPAQSIMPGGTRFEPSSIKNKIKREEVAKKAKKAKSQQKLQKRLAQAKLEATNPALKKVSKASFISWLRDY
jgi:uncharacterized protein YaiI (UPF0178 family)